ncbi:MAG: discoidin domain-containing protein [Merdibacter sp.]
MVKSLIAGVLCLSQLQIPVNVLAAEGEPENLALNEPSGAFSAHWKYQTDDSADEMAVDGDREGDSAGRWSSGALVPQTSPQWLEVDLGSPQTSSGVSLYWEASAGQAYRLEESATAQMRNGRHSMKQRMETASLMSSTLSDPGDLSVCAPVHH